MKKLLIIAVATLTLSVALLISGGGAQSLQFPGNAALQAQGTVNNSNYTSLSQWRVEDRVHNLPSTWSGYSGVFAGGSVSVRMLSSDASNHWIYFADWTDNAECFINFGALTDLTIRVQKDSSGNRTMRVWDSSGNSVGNCITGSARPGADNFGSANSTMTIGGSWYQVVRA